MGVTSIGSFVLNHHTVSSPSPIQSPLPRVELSRGQWERRDIHIPKSQLACRYLATSAPSVH